MPRFDDETAEALRPPVVDPAAIAGMLTVDIQLRYVAVLFTLWGLDGQVWVMDYQKLEGNPTHAAPFDRLVELAQATAWAHPDYGPIEVTRVGIDTGYQPRHVERIARAHPTLVFGMRGETGGLGLPFILEQAKDKHGHSARGWHPLRVNHEATQFAFQAALHIPLGEPGSWHFSKRLDPSVYRELTAEIPEAKIDHGVRVGTEMGG